LPDSLLAHDDAVRLLALTPDGKSAVTVTSIDEKTHLLQVWNLAAGTKQTHKLQFAVQGLTISPDGNFAVLSDANPENSVWRWNLKTLEFSRFWPRGRLAASVWGLAFSPDAQQLLTVGGNHARLWNVAGGERVQTFSPHGALVSAEFSRDAKLVVTAGHDGAAKIWNVAEQRVIAKIAGGHTDEQRRPVPLRGAAFVSLPDGGEQVLTIGDDDRARLWTLGENGAELVRTFHDDNHSIEMAVAALDGRWLLTAARDGTAQLWNIATGELVRTLEDKAEGHTLALKAVAFSSDGRLALTGGDDNLAIVWNVQTGKLVRKLTGHTAGVNAVGFSRDARRAVTASNDSTAKLWDIDTGSEILTLDGHQSEVTAAAIAASGRTILTASRDRTAQLWAAAPVPPALAFAERRALVREAGERLRIDESPSFCDPSTAELAGGKLKLSIAGGAPTELKESLSLDLADGEVGLSQVGTQIVWTRAGLKPLPVAEIKIAANEGMLEIELLAGANHHLVESMMSRLYYTATWDSAKTPAARTLEITYASASGAQATTIRKTIEFAAATETKIARKP
jgi:WD40 repeat protein